MPLFAVCLEGDDIYSLKVIASNHGEAISKAMGIVGHLGEKNCRISRFGWPKSGQISRGAVVFRMHSKALEGVGKRGWLLLKTCNPKSRRQLQTPQ